MTTADGRALRTLEMLPRAPLAVTPTPLLEAANLRRSISGSPPIFLKMDAWTGPGLGGNKVRKLEHVLAPPNREGADTVITSGSAQSNHARVTAAIAARFGLRCILVLDGDPGDPPRGNALLHRLLGAEIRSVDSAAERAETVEAVRRQVEDAGGAPLVVPAGASTPTGALGYVRAALELDAQLTARGFQNSARVRIILPSSSCGTVAGLHVGFSLVGRHRVGLLAVSADVPADEIQETASHLAAGAAEILGWSGEPAPGMLTATDAFVGEGYGIPTPASHEAIHRMGEMEGVVLDPTYTSKAAAALLSGLEEGRFADAEAVVFLHTGGHPALLA